MHVRLHVCVCAGARVRTPSNTFCQHVRAAGMLRYLEWDDYFMALAFLSAQRSKDPSKQVSESTPFHLHGTGPIKCP